MLLHVPPALKLATGTLVAWLFAAAADAQEAPRLVKDINRSNEDLGSFPQQFTKIGNTIFFSAQDPAHGIELWRTDGTVAGTFLLKDLVPGSTGSLPYNLTQVGNRLFFTAQNQSGGTNLWTSDGTPEGTTPAVEIVSGGFPGTLRSFVSTGNKVFYTRTQALFVGTDIYASDGTPAGTVLLNPMDGASGISSRAFYQPGKGLPYTQGAIVFPANETQLWVSDGTVAGTEIMAELPAETSHDLELLAWVGDLLFMKAATPQGTQELWTYEPGSGQLEKISATGTDGAFEWMGSAVALGDKLFFAAMEDDGGELWVSDGSNVGTHQVKDIRPDSFGSDPVDLVAAGDAVFFVADDGSGSTLWRSDGTEQGTREVANGGKRRPLAPRLLTSFGNGISFVTDDGRRGTYLWKSDGTPKGTIQIKKISGPDESYSVKQLAPLGNALLFTGDDGKNGSELWTSNGTPRGTKMLANLAAGTKDGFYPFDEVPMAAIGNKVYFRADDGIRGEELWETDGTTKGTRLVRDLVPGQVGGEPRQLTAAGSSLFFVVQDPKTRDALWKTDGSRNGTRKVIDPRGDEWSSGIRNLTSCKACLVFTANESDTEELWASDGTPDGTFKLMPGGIPVEWPSYLTEFGGSLYFGASRSGEGEELWQSDGTAAGTAMLKSLRPGPLGSSPFSLTRAGHRIFFCAFTDFFGLWTTDGTATGTSRVNDTQLWSGSTDIYPIIPVGENIYFFADDGTHGHELWKSDGTSDGTFLVKDINSTGGQRWEFGSEDHFATVGDILYFLADDGVHGEELWRSDGTAEGTSMVADIFPGAGHSRPADLVVAGDRIYFSADDGSNGREWWTSDGSAEETRMVADLSPGSGGSNPSCPFLHGGKLYFSATTPAYGSELWVIDGVK